jgi:esterase/lipase superfamily enzyme
MKSYEIRASRRALRPTAIRLMLLMLMGISLAGCASGGPRLPVTPNVLRDGSGPELLSKINPELQKPEMQVLYVTDRAKYGQNGDWPLYGYDRSPNVAFGIATVSFKPTPTWEELAKAAGTKEGGKWELSVFSLREKGSVQVSPDSLEVREGSIKFKPEFAAGIEEQKKEFQKALQERLALTPQKDVYLYVHGVDNYFESPILRIATVWHFMGRQGVPVAYSWPAGRGGMLGYFYDRESGEFTVINLKRTLKTIAATPGVERVHLIGHSRGGDITTTALRELNLEYQAKGLDPQKELKLETLVLAAPDLDASVFSTRLLYENMAGIANRIVVYSSSKDKAVGLADKLFHSKNRLGTLSEETIKPGGKRILADLTTIQLVRCDVSGFGTSHDYPFTDPAALSDLILVLRDRRQPGKENGRPLIHLGGAFWMLDNNYKVTEPAALASH